MPRKPKITIPTALIIIDAIYVVRLSIHLVAPDISGMKATAMKVKIIMMTVISAPDMSILYVKKYILSEQNIA